MSDFMALKYVPQVGDRVRLASWSADVFVDVLHVTDEHFYGTDGMGAPRGYYKTAGDWLKVDKPRTIPESWMTVDHDDQHLVIGRDRQAADDWLYPHDTFRIWSDPDGTPRIERVAS